MFKEKILYLRDFNPINSDTSRVEPIAWPVMVYECSANKKVTSELDALAEAVLKLININILEDHEISKLLHVSSDIIRHIKNQKLCLEDSKGFIDKSGAITEYGKDYLNNNAQDVYRDEKTFGYMFVNLFDEDVMPFFYEGKLPYASELPSNITKMLIKDTHKYDSQLMLGTPSQFSEAYKNHHRILKNSQDNLEEEFETIKTGLCDLLPEEVNDFNEEPIKTLADVEVERTINESYVKIFEDTGTVMYLFTKLVVSKENPDEFIIFSPFSKNVTTWYNKKIPFFRLKDNNISVQYKNKIVPMSEFLSDITEEFYIEFPELQASNFDYYMKINFPNLKKVTWFEKNVIQNIKSYHNAKTLYENGNLSPEAVITSGGLLIETILNNYVHCIKNRNAVLDNVIVTSNDRAKTTAVFDHFNITDCFAKGDINTDRIITDLKKRKWRNNDITVGSSITNRYFFLLLEAFLFGKSPFAKVLIENGTIIFKKLDDITSLRNSSGAHNDKTVTTNISDNQITQYFDDIEQATKILINGMYKFEEDK